MKIRRTRSTYSGRRPVTSCSVTVLAALGVLGCAAGAEAWAQAAGTVLPGGTLPVLRGVVSGQAVVNAPVTGAGSRLMTIDQASQRGDHRLEVVQHR